MNILQQAPVQFFRIPRAVKNGENGKRSIFNGKINGVFAKAAQADFLGAAADSLKKSRIGQCATQCRFYFQLKFFPEAWALRFVPNNGLIKFLTGGGFEN